MKLMIFGCSNSAPFHEDTESYKEYKKFKGGKFPPTWSEIISTELSLELENYAIPGSGNDSIRMEFVKNIRNINKDDVVIIGWTFVERYMWINRFTNKWNHHQGGHYSSKMDITRQTHEEIVLHRYHEPSNFLHVEHIYDWIDMINYLSEKLGFKVFYWDFGGRIHHQYYLNVFNSHIILNHRRNIFLSKSLLDEDQANMGVFNYVKSLGGLQIIDETNGELVDHHLGETGHQVLAEIFLKKLKSTLVSRII